MKYIPAEKLIAEIEALKRREGFLPLENMEITEAYMARGVQFACDDIVYIITSLQQEQKEVDLEKFTEKIKTFQGRYKYPEILSIKGAMAFMARMFYQYPHTARQWYESLPKATMN